jgi:glutamate-1-semialdehyde 2,1-aminomutase
MSALAEDGDITDVGGVGGTLAGNAMSMAAMRAVLGEVLTDESFGTMEVLATTFAQGVRDAIDRHGLAWSVSQLGTRCEYRFMNPPPTNGGESAASGDATLNEFLHLYALNRGVVLTPFHNMALMCPATTREHVAAHQRVFEAALDDLVG